MSCPKLTSKRGVSSIVCLLTCARLTCCCCCCCCFAEQILAQERGLENIKRVTHDWQSRILFLEEKMAALEKKLMPEQAPRVRQLHAENVKLSLDIQCLSNLLDIMNDENSRKQLALQQQLQSRQYQAPQPYAYPLTHPYQNQPMINFQQQSSSSSGTPSPNILPPAPYPQFPLTQNNPLYLHQGSSLHPSPSPSSHSTSPTPFNYSTQRGSMNVLSRLLPSPSQVWPSPNSPYGNAYPRPDTLSVNRPMPPLPRSHSDQPRTQVNSQAGASGSQASGGSSAQEDDAGGTWNCAHCTFANYQALRVCEMCDKPRCHSPLGNAIHSIGSLYSQSKRIISTATKKHKHHHHSRRGHHHQERERVSRNNSYEENAGNNDNANHQQPDDDAARTGSH